MGGRKLKLIRFDSGQLFVVNTVVPVCDNGICVIHSFDHSLHSLISMEFIASVFGLHLPTLRARDCLKQRSGSSNLFVAKEEKVLWEFCDEDMQAVPGKAACDDETASTLSDCDSFASSSDCLGSCVTFAAPLVTATFFLLVLASDGTKESCCN